MQSQLCVYIYDREREVAFRLLQRFVTNTTGNRSFAYSRKQSAKAVFLSAKALPTVSPRGCRQRSVGKELVGNDFFADSHVSSCRQSLCRQPAVQSANADGAVNPDRGFADSPDLRLSAKTLPTAAQWLSASLCRQPSVRAVGKALVILPTAL